MTNPILPGFVAPVNVTSPLANDSLRYDAVTGQWLNRTSRVVYVADFPGQDLGQKFNAANAFLGATPGIIQLPNGNYTITTPFRPSANRIILLGVGTLTIAIPLPGGGSNSFISPRMASNVSVIGTGMFTSNIVENTNPGDQSAYAIFDVLDDNLTAFGGYYLSDFKITGNPASVASGTAGTISMGNAHGVYIQRLWLYQTSANGVLLGGAPTGGYHCERAWVTDCIFEGVSSQSVAPVNSRDFHVDRNTFKATPFFASSGTYIDVELNTSADTAEAFTVCGNVIDNRGTNNAKYGILVTGQNPTQEANYAGGGLISGNTIIGCTFAPEAVAQPEMSAGVWLDYVKDILVTDNNFRSCNSSHAVNCTRITFSNNKLTNCEGLTLSNTLNSRVHGNVYETLRGGQTHWSEIGTSDFNYFYNNHIYVNEGGVQPLILINLIGANSRKWNNFINGALLVDGDITMDLRASVHGQAPVFDGATLTPTLIGTSDVGFSIFTPTDIPASFGAGGSRYTEGTQFTVDRVGYVTALKFYKNAGMTGTPHTLTLYDLSNSAQIGRITTSGETASGWQTQPLPTPIRIVPGRTYATTIYSDPAGQAYTLNYWSAGSTVVATPLTVPATGGAAGSAGVDGAPGASVNGFFCDVVFVPNVPAVNSHNAQPVVLHTTALTPVLSVAVPETGNYLLSISIDVANAGTNVTIGATWKQGASQAPTTKSLVILALTSLAVGTYSYTAMVPVTVSAASLVINVTAGTIDNVMVSASAVRL